MKGRVNRDKDGEKKTEKKSKIWKTDEKGKKIRKKWKINSKKKRKRKYR